LPNAPYEEYEKVIGQLQRMNYFDRYFDRVANAAHKPISIMAAKKIGQLQRTDYFDRYFDRLANAAHKPISIMAANKQHVAAEKEHDVSNS